MADKNKESLESREYRDEQGNVHHHTKTYMEQHGESGSSGKSGSSGQSESSGNSESRRDEEGRDGERGGEGSRDGER